MTAKDWFDQGNVLPVLGRYNEALPAYDIAIGIGPGEAYFWHNKGNALAVLGREPLRYPLTQDRAWRGIVTTPMNKFTGIYGLSTDGI